VTAPGAVDRLRSSLIASDPHKAESIHHHDGSAAARRALAEAAALSAEHGAALTVVTLVVHERQAVGCCVPAATWNRELDASSTSN